VTNKNQLPRTFLFWIEKNSFKKYEKNKKKIQKPKTSQIDFLFASPNERKG
jgi:hypothetical protein